MLCWEMSSGHGIHVDDTLTHSTYLNTAAGRVHFQQDNALTDKKF